MEIVTLVLGLLLSAIDPSATDANSNPQSAASQQTEQSQTGSCDYIIGNDQTM